jgi:transcriptional regulator with XRE-family HTH domain
LVSESLTQTPPRVDVGERLRTIRQLRRRTLREVADGAGLSESFLSQVERGRTSVSIASLQRIAGALGIEVSDVFAHDEERRPRVLRRDARPNVAWGPVGRKALLTPKPFHSVEVVVANIDPGGSTGDEPYAHGDSEEVFFVVTGEVELQLGGELFELAEGDSAQYRSSTPHRVRNLGRGPAEVLFIISPPSY